MAYNSHQLSDFLISYHTAEPPAAKGRRNTEKLKTTTTIYITKVHVVGTRAATMDVA